MTTPDQHDEHDTPKDNRPRGDIGQGVRPLVDDELLDPGKLADAVVAARRAQGGWSL